MKQVVYKYPLEIIDFQKVTLPVGSKLLCVKMQDGKPHLWALVNPDETRMETVNIRCAGTGTWISGEVDYIGTILTFAEQLVLHFFKIK